MWVLPAPLHATRGIISVRRPQTHAHAASHQGHQGLRRRRRLFEDVDVNFTERPPLRPHRPQRRRQVDVHEDPRRRPRAGHRHGLAARRRRRSCKQDQFAYEDVRVLDVVCMGNKQLWAAMHEKEELLAQAGHHRRGRAPARRARGASSPKKTATPPSPTPPSCSRGLGIPESDHEQADEGARRAATSCACCSRRRCSASPRRCCSTSPPTTSTSTPSAGSRGSSTSYEGVLVTISHDRHFLNAICTHIADIDYETIITYTGGYDDMVMAKSQVRGARRAGERRAAEEDRPAPGLRRPLRRRHARLAGAEPQEADREAAALATSRSRTSSGRSSSSVQKRLGQADAHHRGPHQALARA